MFNDGYGNYRERVSMMFCAGLLALGISTDSFARDSSALAIKKPEAESSIAGSQRALVEGNFEQAAETAGVAADFYGSQAKPVREMKALVQLAEAQQAIGAYQDAALNLHRALSLAESTDERGYISLILGALGYVYLVLGSEDQAEQFLNKAASQAELVGSSALQASALNNIGNYHAFRGAEDHAIDAYIESARFAKLAEDNLLLARALANVARMSLEKGDQTKAKGYANKAIDILHSVEDSHDKAFLLINVARTFTRFDAESQRAKSLLRMRAFRLLEEAEQIAMELKDVRSASYAAGYMGSLYEDEARHEEALTLTQKAIFQAQQLGEEAAKQPMFLWYWQKGRLLGAMGNNEAAIEAYEQAVSQIETRRHMTGAKYGATFRDSIAPVYLQLVDLLLKDAEQTQDANRSMNMLRRARDTVEVFKAAELRDYFQDDCVDALRATIKDVADVSSSAVVVYPIMLDDRLELLLTLPGGVMKRYSTPIDAEALTDEIHAFRRLLEKRTTNEYRLPGQRLYRWLMEPFAPELKSLDIDTLVFVPDGALRTIPMGALYDGERFLVERYAIATTPGVSLTDPTPLNRTKLKSLYGGLSQSVQGFPALTHVREEITGIQQLYPGKLLLDEAFVRQKLKDDLRDEGVNVLHIATHGEFSGNADSSFVLTYDGRLTINQLAEYVGLFKFRESPLELLVLSACETAKGDDRAALGLSGVAIKAGARSVLGALWKTDDAATSQLIRNFYTQLQDPEVSRAVALQRAQRDLITDLPYRHPAYWSPFILINNWL